MDFLTSVINYLLPILGFILLFLGIKMLRINYIVVALWFSLIALLLQYQTAGGEILGAYFGYKNALLYTLNLAVLIVAFLYLCFKTPALQTTYIRYLSGLIAACLVTGSIILIINLWINARFIEDKLPGTAIMQVVSFTPPNYCAYRYAFYKVNPNNKISYLCPNYYGLIPAIGNLDTAPDFIVRQLAEHAKNK